MESLVKGELMSLGYVRRKFLVPRGMARLARIYFMLVLTFNL